MLPVAFLERMERQLGADYPAFLQSLERPRAVALRFAPGKERRDLPFLREAVPWEPLGVYYDPQARPGLHPYHDAGVYYLQEASAMAPVGLLDPQPGEWVLDLCAAPGGKSTQIAGRMAGKGLLVCNEINPKRSRILSQNIERMGIANALVLNEHPEKLSQRFPGAFDRVLIDAPCSGEGMFRKEEAAVTDWSGETVAMCARRQDEILHSGARMVRPGGRLVYSTCTFAPEEDEEAVARFLESHPDFSPEDVSAPWFERVGEGLYRLWPHKLKGEGHFAAVLRRRGGGDGERPEAEKPAALPKEFSAFAKELGITLPAGQAVLFGQSLFWAPEGLPELRGLKVQRPGLELGAVQKGRFIPAHALALWLDGCARTVELRVGGDVEKYLHGEVLPGKARGWALVQVDGFSLGWAKGDGTWMKNHYPKGLRR